MLLVIFVVLAPNGITGVLSSPAQAEETPMTPLIEARGVTKRFAGFTALEQIDLVVAAGERSA